ncbi:MAG: Maf family protein [Planctomycetota bacterium]
MPGPARPPLLCSASPRRAALLGAAGLAFERGPSPDVDETPPEGVPAEEVAEALAVRKARVAAARAPGRTVLCADTTVVLDGVLLGKPADAADAARMLRALSGRTHAVVTGVAVARDGEVASGADRARVTFRPLDDVEIARYVATGEPLDKAGAYAIQGGAAAFVTRREGRVDTVVGLPVPLVAALLAALSAPSAPNRSRPAPGGPE